MVFSSWPKRWNRHNKTTTIRRGPFDRSAALQLEKLEERTLLSGTPFPLIASSLDSELTILQNQVSVVLDNASSLPFVGHKLGDAAKFVSTFQQSVHTALQGLDNLASDDSIRNALFSALQNQSGPKVLGDLDGNGIRECLGYLGHSPGWTWAGRGGHRDASAQRPAGRQRAGEF